MKLLPLPDPGNQFSIPTMKYRNLPLSKFDENKLTFFGGPMSDLQWSILTLARARGGGLMQPP